jgi:hypothetical protein
MDAIEATVQECIRAFEGSASYDIRRDAHLWLRSKLLDTLEVEPADADR